MKMRREIRRKREERDGREMRGVVREERDGREMRGVVREELMREEGVDREMMRWERN